MASTAAVCNVLSEELQGNGLKQISGFVTFATYDQAANPAMNLSNYLLSTDTPMVTISSSATGYTFAHNGGTVDAGTVVALGTDANGITGAAAVQAANGAALGATVPFVAIGKTA